MSLLGRGAVVPRAGSSMRASANVSGDRGHGTSQPAFARLRSSRPSRTATAVFQVPVIKRMTSSLSSIAPQRFVGERGDFAGQPAEWNGPLDAAVPAEASRSVVVRRSYRPCEFSEL